MEEQNLNHWTARESPQNVLSCLPSLNSPVCAGQGFRIPFLSVFCGVWEEIVWCVVQRAVFIHNSPRLLHCICVSLTINYFASFILGCVDRMKLGLICFIQPACLFPWMAEFIPLYFCFLSLYFMLHRGFLCFPSFFMVCVFLLFYYCFCWFLSSPSLPPVGLEDNLFLALLVSSRWLD